MGLISCLSDGITTVYINNLLVNPDYQGMGIGTKLMNLMLSKYADYEKRFVIAENTAVEFYSKLGFCIGKNVTPMRL